MDLKHYTSLTATEMAAQVRRGEVSPVELVQAILMIKRRVTDLWRLAREDVPDTVNWADLYKKLLAQQLTR